MKRLLLLAAAFAAAPAMMAPGAETDQFLTWDLEIADCAEVLNAHLNEEARTFLEGVNARTQPVETPEELTQAFYLYLFQGLHASRIRNFVNTSPRVNRFPNRSVSFFEYQRISIYRRPAFPFVLPMARTIRVGDVHLGTDKIGHFFGFGRRYFQRYLRHREAGMDEEEAMRAVVRWGIALESRLVGGLVDGIFSHGDLEANFQGFLMARDCAGGPAPFFVREDGQWLLARPIDLRAYITPGFDESYNVSHYRGMRKRQVHDILCEEYCAMLDSAVVRARFERYAAHSPSFSQQVIGEYYAERGYNPQDEQSLENICAECEAEEHAGRPAPEGENP